MSHHLQRNLLTVMAWLAIAGPLCAQATVGTAPSAPAAAALDDFALIDHAGKLWRLSEQKDAPVVVLVVYGVGCPIVRQSASVVQQMAKDFADRHVRFLFIDPTPQDTRKAITDELAKLACDLPVLRDDSQVVSEMLTLKRTAEALVITSKDRVLRWRGPIDDRLGYGAQKPKATHTWLADAITAVLTDKPVPTDADESKGCAITYVQPRDKHVIDYAKDVAPLLQSKCVDCHRDGSIAPWAMKDYAKVQHRSAMMREELLARRMTPWHADPEYGTFANDRGLKPAELRTLVHWIEQDCPRGTAPDPLATKPSPPMPEWPLGKPDLIVDLPEQQVPATGVIPYRMGEVPMNLPKDTWVRAVDLRPSNTKVLHHGFVFAGEEISLDDLPPDVVARIKQRFPGVDLKNLPPNIKRQFGQLNKQPTGLTTFFASYVPGLEVKPFPTGTGKKLEAGISLRYTLHYTTNGEASVDRPRLGLYFHKTPPTKELHTTSAFNLRFVIPPAVKEQQVDAARAFPEAVTLYALSPHMHYRGSWMRFVAKYPDGRSEILLSVPDYDLNWQHTYWLAIPKALPAGTTVQVQGAFDNSLGNPQNPDPTKSVHFGEQSWDEMFIGYLVYTEK